MGINLFLFSSLLLLLNGLLNGISLKRYETLVALGCFLLSGIMVVLINSDLSVVIHFFAFAITLSLFKSKDLKTVYDGLISFIRSYVALPVLWYRKLQKNSERHPALSLSFKFLKLALIPLLIVMVFFLLYQGANPKFEALTADFSKLIGDFFKDLSFGRIIFLLFGFSFISLAINEFLLQIEPSIETENNLTRKRTNYKNKFRHLRGSLLKELLNEYKVGVIVLIMLNLLLFVVNLIDLNWIYFGFEVPENFNLKQFVHEGTYLLIFSILLSMALVLYFFRGSLNFYQKNKALVLLGKIWIIQNAFLTLSVFMRNYHYIDYHGLASKRIGMIAFLCMCVFGLISLLIKVAKKKSTFYLMRVNTWFVFITLVFLSCFNWHRVIIKHNLQHENIAEIDTDHYLELDPRLIPLVYHHLDTIEAQMNAHRQNKQIWVNVLDINLFQKKLKEKAAQYSKRQKERTWASWNLQDQYFKNNVEMVKPNRSISKL